MPEPLKLKDLKLRMQAYGVRPSKKFGQNFLADFNMLRAIVADAEVNAGDCVLEVGTGAGSLTGFLCDAAGFVVSVEIDRGMFELARDSLEGCTNLLQLRADALARSGLNRQVEDVLHAVLAGRPPEAAQAEATKPPSPPPRGLKLKLVANLPYSVATAVLFALLHSDLPFERMVVMVQFEVAEKLAARPGSRHWGLPSLLLSRLAQTRLLRRVPAKVFWPKPKVDSALLELRPAAKLDRAAYGRLRALAHVLFQRRRKTAANALALALGVEAATAAAWIAQAGGDPGARPEDLAPDVLAALADHPDLQPLVARAHKRDAGQVLAKAEKQARRAAWRKRVYKGRASLHGDEVSDE